MTKRRYLQIKENFTHISLFSNDGEEIVEDFGDIPANRSYDCECPVCHRKLTVDQYEKGKLIETQIDNPIYILKHKKCEL